MLSFWGTVVTTWWGTLPPASDENFSLLLSNHVHPSPQNAPLCLPSGTTPFQEPVPLTSPFITLSKIAIVHWSASPSSSSTPCASSRGRDLGFFPLESLEPGTVVFWRERKKPASGPQAQVILKVLLRDSLSTSVLTCLMEVIISTVGPSGGPWKVTVVRITGNIIWLWSTQWW